MVELKTNEIATIFESEMILYDPLCYIGPHVQSMQY